MATNKTLFFTSTFPRAPFGLGIGRYVCQLQRITLKFCKSHGGSRGIREFLEHDLVNFAKENPGVVVYVKPRRHRSPVIVAEYLSGQKHWLPVPQYSREEIVKYIELLRTEFFDSSIIRYRKLWHTEFPSIQGPWTPTTFRDPAINISKFPNEKLSAAILLKPTATEEVKRLFQIQQKSSASEEQNILLQGFKDNSEVIQENIVNVIDTKDDSKDVPTV